MKPESSKMHLRCGLPTFKLVCLKMKWVTINGKYKRQCFCENPCTDSSCGRMVFIYPEKDLRAYPVRFAAPPNGGIPTNSALWLRNSCSFLFALFLPTAVSHFAITYVLYAIHPQLPRECADSLATPRSQECKLTSLIQTCVSWSV